MKYLFNSIFEHISQLKYYKTSNEWTNVKSSRIFLRINVYIMSKYGSDTLIFDYLIDLATVIFMCIPNVCGFHTFISLMKCCVDEGCCYVDCYWCFNDWKWWIYHCCGPVGESGQFWINDKAPCREKKPYCEQWNYRRSNSTHCLWKNFKINILFTEKLKSIWNLNKWIFTMSFVPIFATPAAIAFGGVPVI